MIVHRVVYHRHVPIHICIVNHMTIVAINPHSTASVGNGR